MAYRLLADATVALHAAFIVFVVAGGLLVSRNARWALLHLPAVAWVAWLEFTGAICPLTPLENHFRRMAGASGYAGGFVERYLIPVVDPAGLTAQAQQWLGALVVAVNLAVYAWVAARRSRDLRRSR